MLSVNRLASLSTDAREAPLSQHESGAMRGAGGVGDALAMPSRASHDDAVMALISMSLLAIYKCINSKITLM